MSVYFPTGALKVHLDDDQETGAYMPSGALRVSTTSSVQGVYAADGALRGELEAAGSGYYTADGKVRMSETQGEDGALFVKIVSTQEDEVDIPEDEDGDTEDLNEGTIIFDGGFEDTPTIETNGNGKQIGGKVIDFAKFIYSIGVPQAGFIYTMTYDPDFSGLSQSGALAMVGFGFKEAKKYHLTGLKGDGSTGLVVNQAYGPNFDNLRANSEDEGSAPSNGTQAGPNWLQIEISEAGDTYTLRTSGDDGETWNDEITDDLPDPLSNSTDAEEFGIALYFDAEDIGEFTIDITLWEQGEAVTEAAMATGITRVPLRTTAGTQTITLTADDGWSVGTTPKAVYVLATEAIADGTVTAHLNGSIGAADGTDQWVTNFSARNGTAASDTSRRSATDEVIMITDNTNVVAEANVVSFGADTIELNVGANTTGAAYLITVFAVGGSAVSAEAGVTALPSQNNSVTVTPGFQIDALFASWGEFNDTTLASSLAYYGMASYDGSTIRQASHAYLSSDAADPAQCFTEVRDNAILTARVDRYTELHSITSTEFQLRAIGHDQSAVSAGYLALSFGGEAEAWVGVADTPTATGDHDFTGPSFEPSFAMIIPTLLQEVNTNMSAARGPSFGVSTILSTVEFCNTWRDFDSANTMVTASLSDDVAINLDDWTTGSGGMVLHEFDATFVSFLANGMKMNFTVADAIARKWPMMFIG